MHPGVDLLFKEWSLGNEVHSKVILDVTLECSLFHKHFSDVLFAKFTYLYIQKLYF